MEVGGNGQRIGGFKIIFVAHAGTTGKKHIGCSSSRWLMMAMLHFQLEDVVIDDAEIIDERRRHRILMVITK
jgi:hypothetical protein